MFKILFKRERAGGEERTLSAIHWFLSQMFTMAKAGQHWSQDWELNPDLPCAVKGQLLEPAPDALQGLHQEEAGTGNQSSYSNPGPPIWDKGIFTTRSNFYLKCSVSLHFP